MDVQDLAGAAYDAVLEPALWPDVLDQSCKLFSAEMAALRVFDRDGAELLMIAYGGCLSPEMHAQYRANWVSQDIHNQKARETPSLWNRPIVPEFELVAPEEERRSAYIQEFLLNADLCRILSSMSNGPNGMVTAAFFKSPSAPLADESDLSVGAALLPHLNRAARMAAASAAHAVASAFEHVGHAVFLLDDAGRLVWCNAPAGALLQRGVFSSGVGAALHAEGAGNDLIEALTREARRRGGRGGAPRVALHNDGGEPIILRGRVIGRQTWPCLLYQRAAVLIECHPMAISASAAERMQQAFGLTPAEAAVSVALAEDASVAEIAHRRGVSEETVRSQSQAILRKVGVSRRAALIRAVTKLSD